MKKITGLLLVLTLWVTGLFAQESTVSNYIALGIKLHDKGDYSSAIDFYKKALLIDNKSASANYEIAASYFALKQYQNTIKFADKVIAINTNNVDQAYTLKGSSYDLLGKPQDAVKTYKKALQKYTGNHLLYYNLALTSFNLKKYSDTEDALQKSLKLNQMHAGSHFLMGLCMVVQEKRVQGILALYNFLLLEPKTKRAGAALQTLEEELAKGVKKENKKPATTTLPAKKDDDEFYTADLMLNLLESSKNNETNKNKPAPELFAENTNSFFTILGEMKKDKKGFWWKFYVDYFYTIATEKHSRAFCYYITQSKDSTYDEWIKDKNNLTKMEEFSEWYTKYLHKF